MVKENIENLKVGGLIPQGQVFLLSEVEKRLTSQNKPFITATFQDASGVIKGMIWSVTEEVEAIAKKVKEENGIYVNVQGKVSSYRDIPQLDISHMTEVPEGAVNLSDFIPHTLYDIEGMWSEVERLTMEMEVSDYREILVSVFRHNNGEYLHKFKTATAALRMHHNYIGGLLEHSIQVTHFALGVADSNYGFKELDRNLIIAGGLLHDVGKIDEYMVSKGIQMNPYGIDHRYQGVSIVNEAVKSSGVTIDPEKLKNVLNIIMSHHGETYGDRNVKFLTPEAEIIHCADMMSASTNGYFMRNKGV